MIEKIEDNGELQAIILRGSYKPDELNFMTEEKHPFQVGIHNAPKGKRYHAHASLPFKKLENLPANKIYFVKKGKVGIDFYNLKGEKTGYATLHAQDLILLVGGGHGVDVLENSEFIEIKQGPYRGRDDDKTFLEPI